jgi:hypothetical protein
LRLEINGDDRLPEKIAILHTSVVFASVEPVINDLINELIPDAEVKHLVDSDVPAAVEREAGISPQREERVTHLALAAEVRTTLAPTSDLMPERVAALPA